MFGVQVSGLGQVLEFGLKPLTPKPLSGDFMAFGLATKTWTCGSRN